MTHFVKYNPYSHGVLTDAKLSIEQFDAMPSLTAAEVRDHALVVYLVGADGDVLNGSRQGASHARLGFVEARPSALILRQVGSSVSCGELISEFGVVGQLDNHLLTVRRYDPTVVPLIKLLPSSSPALSSKPEPLVMPKPDPFDVTRTRFFAGGSLTHAQLAAGLIVGVATSTNGDILFGEETTSTIGGSVIGTVVWVAVPNTWAIKIGETMYPIAKFVRGGVTGTFATVRRVDTASGPALDKVAAEATNALDAAFLMGSRNLTASTLSDGMPVRVRTDADGDPLYGNEDETFAAGFSRGVVRRGEDEWLVCTALGTSSIKQFDTLGDTGIFKTVRYDATTPMYGAPSLPRVFGASLDERTFYQPSPGMVPGGYVGLLPGARTHYYGQDQVTDVLRFAFTDRAALEVQTLSQIFGFIQRTVAGNQPVPSGFGNQTAGMPSYGHMGGGGPLPYGSFFNGGFGRDVFAGMISRGDIASAALLRLGVRLEHRPSDGGCTGAVTISIPKDDVRLWKSNPQLRAALVFMVGAAMALDVVGEVTTPAAEICPWLKVTAPQPVEVAAVVALDAHGFADLPRVRMGELVPGVTVARREYPNGTGACFPLYRVEATNLAHAVILRPLYADGSAFVEIDVTQNIASDGTYNGLRFYRPASAAEGLGRPSVADTITLKEYEALPPVKVGSLTDGMIVALPLASDGSPCLSTEEAYAGPARLYKLVESDGQPRLVPIDNKAWAAMINFDHIRVTADGYYRNLRKPVQFW